MVKQRKGSHRDLVAEKDWRMNKETGRVTVLLKPGFAFVPNRDETLATHTEEFPSAGEAKLAVTAAKPCNCDRCACPKTKGMVR